MKLIKLSLMEYYTKTGQPLGGYNNANNGYPLDGKWLVSNEHIYIKPEKVTQLSRKNDATFVVCEGPMMGQIVVSETPEQIIALAKE